MLKYLTINAWVTRKPKVINGQDGLPKPLFTKYFLFFFKLKIKYSNKTSRKLLIHTISYILLACRLVQILETVTHNRYKC